MKILNEANFENEVSNGLHLVDFWADWCAPCKMQSPILEDLSRELAPESAKISKVNVDQNPGLAQKFGIQSIPTMLIISNGRVVDRLVGLRTKQDLKTELGYHM
ncbi:thioredoxin [Enterococcus raffinosus]|uniref:thioredoxin n=1 Tax=Enterococcus raffinosus TaxID=71452 RepID=UPI001C124252|nr:thioredoxin [Enterococcus raffinosus]MBU5362844.1 thioredoxin [Enterococcus raffinosus]